MWWLIALLVAVKMRGGSSSDPVQIAREYLGRPYFCGAGLDKYPEYPDPPWIDCGLLTSKVIRRAYGVTVPRTVTEQVAKAPYTLDVEGEPQGDVDAQLRRGQFLAFGREPNGRYKHTGIVSKSGPGAQILHASLNKGKVVESPFVGYWSSGWRTIYAWKPI